MLSEIKDHFDHGGQLAQSHLPALLHIGGVIGADPLVQAAINTALSDSGKAIVVDLVQRLESLEQEHAAAAPADEPAAAPAA
jgi:hypothetical protein